MRHTAIQRSSKLKLRKFLVTLGAVALLFSASLQAQTIAGKKTSASEFLDVFVQARADVGHMLV